MKTKNILLVSLIIVLAINFSCKKQEDVTLDKIANGEVSFSPMEVGNYWIYSVYTIDQTGIPAFTRYDSTYIVGTKEINGNTFYEYRSNSSATYVQYLRDSMSYLVDDSGEKFFHPSTSDTLKNDKIEIFGFVISHTYRVMHTPSEYIECDAGAFKAMEARLTTSLPLLNTKTVASRYYSANIGLIKREDAPELTGNQTIYSLLRWSQKE